MIRWLEVFAIVKQHLLLLLKRSMWSNWLRKWEDQSLEVHLGVAAGYIRKEKLDMIRRYVPLQPFEE